MEAPATANRVPSAVVDPSYLTSKRVLFVGGLPDDVSNQLIRAAMVPFGTIRAVDMVSPIGMISVLVT